MKTLQYFSAILAMVFFVPSFADTVLTHESVSNLLDSVTAAVKKKDAGEMATYFTPDANIVLDMPPAMGGRIQATVPEYAAMLREAWSAPMKTTYDVYDVNISIAPDGSSATVTDVTVETIEMGGQRLETKSDERAEVVFYNGAPRISDLYAKLRM